MSSEKLLEIKNLTVHFESFDATVHAVENLNLSLRHGETLGLVGETGRSLRRKSFPAKSSLTDRICSNSPLRRCAKSAASRFP